MTGSTIATTVSVGVTVGGSTYPSPLTITAAGTVAPSTSSATGVYAAAGANTVTVINQGAVSGGGGGYFGGGVGGDGVDFLAIASLTNSGTISGGAAGPYGKPSAYGGVGVDLAAGGGVTNGGTIFGGTGGEYGLSAPVKEGHGGAGGDAVDMAAGTLTNTSTIHGGNGGSGGSSLGGGFGGNGAIGVDLTGGSLTNSGAIIGGAGGFNGGDTAGAGIVVGAGATATNDAAILGGLGGNGGYSPYFNGRGYSGSGGGGAVLLGGMLTNLGTITGGTGGVGGYVGAGAPGVIIQGGTLVAAGTISGGYPGGGGAQFDAVAFQGTVTGMLVLEPGAVFNGTVAGNGVGILELAAGTSANTLSGLGTEFTGFERISVASAGNWALPGNFTAGQGQPGVVMAANATVTAGATIAGGNVNYGGAGGAAFMLGANDSLVNHGAIAGGAGGYGGTSHSAGAGGTGIDIAANDSVTNAGSITGGAGGHDYSNPTGGAGGDGVDLAGGTLVNNGGITGGYGGREAGNGLSGVAAGNAPGGFGVDLTAGASVTNDGSITGGSLGDGAYLNGATLSNNQTLAGGYRGDGASLTAGAILTNDATITGGSALGNAIVNHSVPAPVGNGVALTSHSSLINNGTITGGFGGAGAVLDDSTMTNTLILNGGEYGDGATLVSGASMKNDGTITGGGGSDLATVSNGASGAGVGLASSTLTNDGTITGGLIGDGVYLASGAALSNLGMIVGGQAVHSGPGGPPIPGGGISTYGVHLTAGAVVTNTGTIAGGPAGGGADLSGGTLVNAGYIKPGKYNYAPGVTLSGGTLINSGTIAGRAAYTLTVPPHMGPGGSYPGGTYTIAATPAVRLGSLAARLVVDPGAAFMGAVAANTAAGDTLEFGAGTAAGTLAGLGSSITGFAAIAFDPGAAWTVQGSVSAFGAGQSIAGFGTGDTIDLQNELFGASPTLEPSADALTISGDGNSVTLNIAGAGTDIFHVATDAATTGTDLSAQCFCAGTRILTTRGEVVVEALAVGDLVQTHRPGLAPVRWLGHRRIDCVRHPRRENVWPVRVLAGAFGDGRPRHDLFLSPDHAVFIDGVLIPIRYLVNGRTVVQEPRDAVTYWHVELDRHEVIFAEGLACESYLDTGNRAAFANGGGSVQMHPDFALGVWETAACARLVVGGAELEAARSRLLARAEALGHALTGDPDFFLIADQTILRSEVIGGTRRFRVPHGATAVRLVSRSAVPAHVRDDSTDHRRLGIAVSGVRCDGRIIPLTDPRFGSGWHQVEQGAGGAAWRWTDGDAGLAVSGDCVLDIEVVMTGRYWLTEAVAASDCASVAYDPSNRLTNIA